MQYVRTFTAATNLTGLEGRALKIDGTGKVSIAGSAGETFGLLLDGGKVAEDQVSVLIEGRGRIVVASAINPGAWLNINASGKGTVATTGSFVIGRSTEETATTVGQECEIWFSPQAGKKD